MHYGETEHFGVKNFPVHCVEKIQIVAKENGITGRALDVGCAVGRSTIELAKAFDSAVGLDFSEKLIATAQKIQSERFSEINNKIQFVKGDACKLDPSLGKFDIVFAGNVVDRLYDPEAFIRGVVNFMNPKSLIVLTSPYSWLEEFTPIDKWLGGKQINGKDVTGYERINQIFTELGLK